MRSTAPAKRPYGPVPPKASGKSPRPSVLADFLLEEDAARELGIKPKTLREYRQGGVGPEFAVVARRVLYSRDALAKWLAAGGTKGMAVLLVAWLLLASLPTVAAPLTVSGRAWVKDGDTVVVAGVTVRLKGVDAAERGTERGESARRIMVKIVNGGVLSCNLTGEKTWKREVGFCFTPDGTDINREIIARGAALACPRHDSRYLQFEKAEAVAEQPRSTYCVRRAR